MERHMGRLLLKAIQLAIAIAIVALIESQGIVLPRPLLTAGTFVGFTIVCAALVLAHVISSPVDKRIDILLSTGGAILFIASGSLIIDAYKDKNTPLGFGKEHKDYAMATGGLSIINAVVFIVDAFITFRS